MNERRFLQVITEEGDHHFVLYDDIKKVKIQGTTVALWLIHKDFEDWHVTENVANVRQILSDLEGITSEDIMVRLGLPPAEESASECQCKSSR